MKPGRSMWIARAPANRPLKGVGADLPLVPLEIDRVDCHEAQPATHAAGGEQIRLAERDDRNVQRTAGFQQARLLEMADDKSVVTLALGLDAVADRLRRAAELGQRMEKMVGRIEPVHL